MFTERTTVILQVVEVVPSKKWVWLVTDCHLHLFKDTTEWKNTRIVFGISEGNQQTRIDMTHVGLVPGVECYNVCEPAWHRYWKPGSWGLPSGYAERHEQLEETLCREIREETGYQVDVRSLLRLVSGYKLRIEASYVGDWKGGDLQLDPKEVIEARFFAVDELPEGLLPAHREIIALAFSG